MKFTVVENPKIPGIQPNYCFQLNFVQLQYHDHHRDHRLTLPTFRYFYEILVQYHNGLSRFPNEKYNFEFFQKMEVDKMIATTLMSEKHLAIELLLRG